MIEGVKEILRECKKPVQFSRLSGRIHRMEEVKSLREREQSVNVLELGESKHAHPEAIKPSTIVCCWPYLQVSWVHLTNVSTEVFMGHAATLQEVRYL